MTAPEFSRAVSIDTLGAVPRTFAIEADAAERTALAQRFGFVAIPTLAAELALTRLGEAVSASGTLRARVTQSCVATGDPVEEQVEESFEIEFRPYPPGSGAEAEIELGESELDVIFYDGAFVDVGEAVAETLSLAVAAFPRSEAAEQALREAGVVSEEEAPTDSGPFAALSALKDKLNP